jgi:peptide/nickel transport system substrate-binding protein
MGTTDAVEVSLDPAESYDYFGWEIIQSTGSSLVDIRPGSAAGPSDIVPALATSWEVSSDGLTWTFNLRQGVKFQDGTEFTANDVKYSFDRNVFKLAIPEGPQVGIGYGDIIKSVDVMSPTQVVFHLNIPFSPFLSLMAAQSSYIVNPKLAPEDHAVAYTEGDARASSPMDLGPYVLSSWVRVAGKDNEMRLDANSNYWNASGGYPKTPHIIIKFYSDATTLRLAIESGEVDIAFRQLRASDINDLKTKTNVKVWEGIGAFIQYLVFQEKMKPLDNPEIRRAIAAAVDRPTLTDTVFLGQSQPLYSMIPNGMAGHTDAFKQLGDANYAFTREALAKYGYNENNKLKLDLWYESSGHYPQSPDQATVLKSSLEGSGVIQIELKSADWPSYRVNRNQEIMQMYILGWYPDYVDADNYMFPFLHSVGGSWIHMNYNNPQMDDLINQARAKTDAAERSQLYAQAQELFAQDAPIVPLFQGTAWAVTKPNVGGVVLDISQSWRHWLVYATEGPAPLLQIGWLASIITRFATEQ